MIEKANFEMIYKRQCQAMKVIISHIYDVHFDFKLMAIAKIKSQPFF